MNSFILEFLKFTQTGIGVTILTIFFTLLLLNLIYFKCFYRKRLKIIRAFFSNKVKLIGLKFIDILLFQLIVGALTLLIIIVFDGKYYFNDIADNKVIDTFFPNVESFENLIIPENIYDKVCTLYNNTLNMYYIKFLLISGITIIIGILYFLLSKKMLLKNLKKKYINEYEKTKTPLLIINIYYSISQYQTRNIYTGAILYTLPKNKQLNLSVVNISSKTIKGFEIVLKHINSFNELIEEKKIIIDKYVLNNYKPVDINENVNITKFNTYYINRVIFSDGEIWNNVNF